MTTTKLMGDANWWLPGWLDRLLPTIDIEGTVCVPEPELVDAVDGEQADREAVLV
ncbi:MAG: hypothetical protein OEV40_19610 [Acidimicrobiia bacterium]|nr:hypothetical protein [Acidimicrobiia bacterium]